MCTHPKLVQTVAAILLQKSVHSEGFYTGNVRYHRKTPFMMMFLPIEHAGNKLRLPECLVLRHPVRLAE